MERDAGQLSPASVLTRGGIADGLGLEFVVLEFGQVSLVEEGPNDDGDGTMPRPRLLVDPGLELEEMENGFAYKGLGWFGWCGRRMDFRREVQVWRVGGEVSRVRWSVDGSDSGGSGCEEFKQRLGLGVLYITH